MDQFAENNVTDVNQALIINGPPNPVLNDSGIVTGPPAIQNR